MWPWKAKQARNDGADEAPASESPAPAVANPIEDAPPGAVRRIVETAGLMLPVHGTVRRRPPRAAVDQQDDYHDWFDSETVFADVISAGDDLVMVGPPLLNLEQVFSEADWRADGQVLPVPLETTALNRAQTSRLNAVGPLDQLSVTFAGEYEVTVRPSTALHDLLAERTVLVAMQRNNPLGWIQEWLRFYNVINGVDALVLYDMSSTHYSTEQLMEAISNSPLQAIIIVKWPYKYGAKPKRAGDPWDSDYGQYVAWEHCKQRFLAKANAVTVADLDELFLTQDGRTIFEHAADSPTGGIAFKQRFIETGVTGSPRADTDVRFDRYRHFDPEKPVATPKYAAILSSLPPDYQLLVHSIGKAKLTPTEDVIGRQFNAMKLNWAQKAFDRRHADVALDETMALDEQLDEAFRRLGG